MIDRKIDAFLDDFFKNIKKALLITGARPVRFVVQVIKRENSIATFGSLIRRKAAINITSLIAAFYHFFLFPFVCVRQ